MGVGDVLPTEGRTLARAAHVSLRTFHFDRLPGMEQLSLEKDEDKLAELDLLREYLNEAIETIDRATQEVASAPDRLKKLLESPNKKDTLRDMAADGEIDAAFMDLLDQNIEGAEEAGREDVAEFKKKIKVACAKFAM